MNGEKPYFHIEWIMDNVFKLTPEEKAENEKYWIKDAAGAGAGLKAVFRLKAVLRLKAVKWVVRWLHKVVLR